MLCPCEVIQQKQHIFYKNNVHAITYINKSSFRGILRGKHAFLKQRISEWNIKDAHSYERGQSRRKKKHDKQWR